MLLSWNIIPWVEYYPWLYDAFVGVDILEILAAY